MEIDRETLIKLLEVFADTAEVFQRESALYQLLFTAACKAKGLTDGEIQAAVDRGRIESADRIKTTFQAGHQSLLARLPQLVDLLASDQDAALKLLRESTPKGLPN
jgi:hypothetical protein